MSTEDESTAAMRIDTAPTDTGHDWLLLVYRIPPEPTRLRAAA